MNPQTVAQDIQKVVPGGVFIYNADMKVDASLMRTDVINIEVPFRELVNQVTDSIKLKKLLTNMVYVGIVAELLNIEDEALHGAINSQFRGKKSVIDVNPGRTTVCKGKHSGRYSIRC